MVILDSTQTSLTARSSSGTNQISLKPGECIPLPIQNRNQALQRSHKNGPETHCNHYLKKISGGKRQYKNITINSTKSQQLALFRHMLSGAPMENANVLALLVVRNTSPRWIDEWYRH